MSRRVSSSSMWFVAWSLEKTVGHGGHGHQIQPIKERKEALCQDVAPFGPATDQRVFCAGAQLSMYRLYIYMVLYRLCKQWILFLINLNLCAFCPISLTKPKTCPAEHQKKQKTLNSSILSYSGLFRVSTVLCGSETVCQQAGVQVGPLRKDACSLCPRPSWIGCKGAQNSGLEDKCLFAHSDYCLGISILAMRS